MESWLILVELASSLEVLLRLHLEGGRNGLPRVLF